MKNEEGDEDHHPTKGKKKTVKTGHHPTDATHMLVKIQLSDLLYVVASSPTLPLSQSIIYYLFLQKKKCITAFWGYNICAYAVVRR
jgi:hypothetical protein